MKTGALFDLDGVLIDSETGYTVFWAAIGREYNCPSPTFALDIKGTTLTDILTTNFPDAEVQEEIRRKIHDFESKVDYPLYPGAARLVEELRAAGIATAIVTSSDNVKMSYLRRQHPDFLDLFDTIVDGSMVSRSKPNPEGYLRAAELLGCRPEDCFVFEDSLQGIEAGKRAGCTVVAIATTNSRDCLAPLNRVVVDTVGDVTVDMLKNLMHN